jgi:hypothetical protein
MFGSIKEAAVFQFRSMKEAVVFQFRWTDLGTVAGEAILFGKAFQTVAKRHAARVAAAARAGAPESSPAVESPPHGARPGSGVSPGATAPGGTTPVEKEEEEARFELPAGLPTVHVEVQYPTHHHHLQRPRTITLPPSRTNRTRLVPSPVLTGHVSSLPPY